VGPASLLYSLTSSTTAVFLVSLIVDRCDCQMEPQHDLTLLDRTRVAHEDTIE
jgi:hypothetical protein